MYTKLYINCSSFLKTNAIQSYFSQTNDFNSALFQDSLKNIIIVIKLKHTDSNELKDAIEP